MSEEKTILRPEVVEFAEAMEKVLIQNDNKGVGINVLIHIYLIQEIGELAETILNGTHLEIRKECIDVANYAMMLFSNRI